MDGVEDSESLGHLMRILIAENDLHTRQVLQEKLEANGYDIIPATDGLEAWEIYQRETVKMVITELVLPKMDGMTLCRNIKNLKKDFYT